MRKTQFALLLLLAAMFACKPMEKVTDAYIDREALPSEPYDTVCVLAIVRDPAIRVKVEEKMVELIHSQKKGMVALESNKIIPGDADKQGFIPKEELAKIFEQAGCQAAVTVALKDIKTESRYTPKSGESYNPRFSYLYYDNYYRYYTFENDAQQNTGTMEVDKTYFVETNFYDLATEKILWSIQSESFNPDSFDNLFNGYAKMLTKELKQDGLIRK
ncbi:hypothetical protein [Mangrovibacterium diazotrophicum]|nr:hypothetical protein [Mangrovibacterium diazotrophicum]